MLVYVRLKDTYSVPNKVKVMPLNNMFPTDLFENVPETLTIPQCPAETIGIVFLNEVKEVSD